MNKYIFFREYYKPICIALYPDDARAEAEAQKLANELGELVIVCRHLTKYAPDVASAASAEPDSGLESVPAVESDTQPRG